MATWMRTLWNGLLFRDEAFTGLRERRDAFLQGFLIIVIIALVIGLPTLIGDLAKGLRPNAIEAELDQAMSEMDQMIEQMQPFLGNMPSGELDAIMAQVKENMRFGFNIATQVESLPTFLPKPINTFFEQVGKWVSQPFTAGGFPLGRGGPGHLVGLRHLGDALREAARRTRHAGGILRRHRAVCRAAPAEFLRVHPDSRRHPRADRLLLGPGDLHQGHSQQPPDDAWDERCWQWFCRCCLCCCSPSSARWAWRRFWRSACQAAAERLAAKRDE